MHTYPPHDTPALPWASTVQVPGVALHTSQPPLHAVLQHTLSMQLPLAHCVPTVQLWPFLARHAPVAEQELVPVQVSRSSALLTVVQVPGVAAQVWQFPVHAPVQQKPSLQTRVPPHSRQPVTLQSPPEAVLQELPAARRS